MKIYKAMSWQFEKTAVDGYCELFGVNIFNYNWDNTGEKIRVKDPIYQQYHTMSVYKVEISGSIHTFAAGEFSNCVYGFYLYKY